MCDFDLSDEMLVTKSERQFIGGHFTEIKQWTIHEVNVFAQCLEVLEEDAILMI